LLQLANEANYQALDVTDYTYACLLEKVRETEWSNKAGQYAQLAATNRQAAQLTTG
jgi:hypothetical protein